MPNQIKSETEGSRNRGFAVGFTFLLRSQLWDDTKTLVDAASGANNSNRTVNYRQMDSRQRIKTMTQMYAGMAKKEYMKSMAGLLANKQFVL